MIRSFEGMRIRYNLISKLDLGYARGIFARGNCV